MKRTFEIPSCLSALEQLLDQIESQLQEEQLPHQIAGEVRLLAEEAVSNIIRYAYRGGEDHAIEVAISWSENEVELEIRDQGTPFNPLDVPPPDLDQPIENRPDGGLGIHLMKSLADDASYTREGKTNVLVLKKRF